MNYRETITQTIADLMSVDEKIVIFGAGVADAKGIFGTTKLAHEQFLNRVIETPLSEHTLTGMCVGLAVEGWKPIFVHARNDFLTLSWEHLVNTAAKWPFLSDRPVTMVVRALIGRGWGQGPNHSQSFHGMLAQVPGLTVDMPATIEGVIHSYSQALSRPTPTVILEHRSLYETELHDTDFTWTGPWNDITIAGISSACLEVSNIAIALRQCGKKPHAFAIQRISRKDLELVVNSVKETGRVVIIDCGVLQFGVTAELEAMCYRAVQGCKVIRLGSPFAPCATSWALEKEYYPIAEDIWRACRELYNGDLPLTMPIIEQRIESPSFRGPF